MASWNPSPTIGGANWSGNAQLATKNQLLSSIEGLYDDLKDFNFSTISVSTLNVPNWISTPVLYVSDIQGARIDISGIVFDASGLFYAPVVSSQTGNFQNITNISIMQFTFKPEFTGNIQVSFDLGLGQALGGFLAGLGAAIGGAFIGIGTAVGLAIQGAEQGIATMIAGRPQNFINNYTYETINFTSQLQVSTLGNAYPAYSSIFRTVSSVAADSVPGREIFTSTIFYPGQICIRSVSDPFNLISGDANLNTSTIQSFGQWVPLQGLEPEDIYANSISTNYISAGQIVAGLAGFETLVSPNATFCNASILNNLSNAYNAPHFFDLGSSGDAQIIGSINQWNFQTDQPIVFSQLGQPETIVPGAILTLGTGAQSLLQISSITGTGNFTANTGYFSSLIVNDLIVVSTLSTLYQQQAINVLSTNLVTASLVSTNYLQANNYVAPVNISSFLGNPIGQFDIKKYDFVVSTTYNQVSSLTQNILNYSLNIQIQDQTSFNLNIAETPFGVNYNLTPQNVTQWASTLMIFNDYLNPGAVTLPVASAFSNANLTGTFDIQTQYNPQTPGYFAPFYVVQTWIPGSEFSTFSTFLQASGPNPPTPVPLVSQRYFIGKSGWIESIQNNPTPYQTSNNNTFSIYQDINDTTISATDRLNLNAGEIFFDGTMNFSYLNTGKINAVTGDIRKIKTDRLQVSTIAANTILTSTLVANPLTGGLNTYYYKSTISWNAYPQTTNPLNFTFSNDSPDFLPQYTLIPNFVGNNYFTSYNQTSWNNSVWLNTTSFTIGAPSVYLGDLNQPLGTYAAKFWINNDTGLSPAYALPVQVITSAGLTTLGNIPGNTFGLIQTTNGTTWTLTCNVPNPQGSTKAAFNNIFNIEQQYQQTNLTNTQNLYIQSPNTTLTTGTFFFNADQIRTLSHKYGNYATAGLNSYPIGIENNVYQDNGMVFSNVPAASDYWQSDATNILYNITNQIFYDANSWILQVIPSRFRTNKCQVVSWDVQPAVFPIPGGGVCYGYNRYIQVIAGPGGPGNNTTDNWNWYMAIPKNYCSYLL